MKLKKFVAAITCPRSAFGLFTWMKASKGIKKHPPATPSTKRRRIVAKSEWEKRNRKKRPKQMMKPAMQEIPGSTRSFERRPAKTAPNAMPTAVDKKRYPPPISLSPRDCMAKGMIFIWVKAPKKRKKDDPKREGRRWGIFQLNFKVL